MSSNILTQLMNFSTSNDTQLLRMAQLALSITGTNNSLNSFFMLVMAIIIYFMQCGFAFLEAGAVRSKNTTNILIKNILDSFFGCMAYYVLGYAIAFGKPGNAFCGTSGFVLAGVASSGFHVWFFHFVFAATAATIVSGAVAERCEFIAYIVYSFLITGFVYPIASHWGWDPSGWLYVGIKVQSGDQLLSSAYMDFAGSGVVHITGGAAAFVGGLLLGPRIGRFDKDTKEPVELRGHSVPLASLGGFILFFGFFAFNGGSQASISATGDGAAVAVSMVNTIISGSIAAFTVLVLTRVRGPYWSLLTTINGALAGMVAICAGCNVVYPWGAVAIGFLSGISYMLWSMLILKLKIDDPLDAVAVHFGSGLLGVLAVAFLHRDRGILFLWNPQSGLDLLIQLIGAVSLTAWSAGCSLIIFGTLRLLKCFRVSREMEIKGLDFPKHGEMAYPLTAYGHGWNEDNAVPEIGAVANVPEVVINYDKFENIRQSQNGFDNIGMTETGR